MGWKLPESKHFVLLSLSLAIVGGGATMLAAGEAVISSLFGFLTITLICALAMEERKLAKAIDEHERARESYEAIVGKLPIGLLATRNGQVLFSNSVWSRSHGEDLSSLLDSIHAVDRVHLLEALDRAEKSATPFAQTIRVQTNRGTIHYETYGTPVSDAAGNLKHVLMFCVDVTPVFQAKNELVRKHREVDEKNYQLNAALRQVEHSVESIVRTMVRAVEAKDPYTAGHSERVRQYAVWMGEDLGLSKYEMRILDHGATIHDVGKLGVPDEILTKPGALTTAEYATIKLHTVKGAEIVADIDMFRDCVPIVRWHHERLDGSGYPDGLKGEDIPFLARLVAVADVFDAMTSSRSYRAKMDKQEALTIMAQDVASGKLDAIAFDTLCGVISSRGTIDLEQSQGQSQAA